VSRTAEKKTVETVRKAIESAPERKFKETVEVSVNLRDVDLSVPKNRLDEEVILPKGRGKPIKICVFGSGEMAQKARTADLVIQPQEIESYAGDKKKAAELQEKMLSDGGFTLEDFRDQLRSVRKMGPLESLIGMIPGLSGRAAGLAGAVDERSLGRVEAIINSMTPDERVHPEVIDGSRRRRIAHGSGTSIQDVNRLMKQFDEAKKLIKRVGEFEKRGKKGKFPFPLS